MKIICIGTSSLFFHKEEARRAITDCGLDYSDDMEIIVAYEPNAGCIEMIVRTHNGLWHATDIDGWNKINSLTEISEDMDAHDIETIFGEGAAKLPIWSEFLTQQQESKHFPKF